MAHHHDTAAASRTAAAMRSAQWLHDTAAPEDDLDDDALSPEQALEQATDELLHQPEAMTDWLAKKSDGKADAILMDDAERLRVSAALLKGEYVEPYVLFIAWIHSQSEALDHKIKLAMREQMEADAPADLWVQDRVRELIGGEA